MKHLFWSAVAPVVIVLFGLSAHAQSIQTIKGQRVLLNLGSANAQVGDIYVVKNPGGANVAQVQIKQVKNRQAIAFILKGTLAAENTALPKYSLARLPAKAEVKVPQSSGYYAGLSQNQLSVNLTNETALQMKGLSPNLGYFYERALSGRLQALFRGGYEGLKAAGTLTSSACAGTNDCNVDIGYLGMDAILKYSFFGVRKSWWLGGGIGFWYPIMKKSNILDTEKMTLSEKFILSTGMNFQVGQKNFIPIQLEYGLQPSNNVVTSNQIQLRIGFGKYL